MEGGQNPIDPHSHLATPLNSESSTPSRTNSQITRSPTRTCPTAAGSGSAPISISRSGSGTRSRSSNNALNSNNRRIQRACTFCQKKKTKCDGRKPKCGFCVRSGAICTYTTSKKENYQLHLQSLEQRLGAYESLLRDIVARSTEDGRRGIEDAIQRHFQASPEFFSTLLSASPLTEQEILPVKLGLSLARMHQAWQSNPRSDTLTLVQEPPIRVISIQHWTSLVDDDVASHLLSLYFTWENPTWQLIDQTVFIHDLNNRKTRFCSSLLVHTLLFFGCSFSYNLDRITNRREEKILGEKLYAEIQRLWHQKESNKIDLPTIQSCVLIGLICCTFGIDKIGTSYIMHGAEMSARLGLERVDCEYFACSDEEDYDGQALSNCQKFVSWAVFDIQALACQVYRKPPTWNNQPSVYFSLEEATTFDQGEQWSPYPFSTPISQPFFHTASCFRSGLVAIVNDIARFALKFPVSVLDEDDWEYGRTLYQRLLVWNEGLPWSVLPRYNATPHVICLHLYYQATILSLCEIFLLNSSSPDSTSPSPFNPILIKPVALDTFANLVLLFKSSHGYKSIPIVMLHYFCLAGIHSISHLSSSPSPSSTPSELDQNPNPSAKKQKWSLVLQSSVLGLWHMSLGWGRLCKAFLRTIDLVLRAARPGLDEASVSEKVWHVLGQIGGGMWTGLDTKALAADYVVYHDHFPASEGGDGRTRSRRSKGKGKKAHGLQELLVQMEGLDFGVS